VHISPHITLEIKEGYLFDLSYDGVIDSCRYLNTVCKLRAFIKEGKTSQIIISEIIHATFIPVTFL